MVSSGDERRVQCWQAGGVWKVRDTRSNVLWIFNFSRPRDDSRTIEAADIFTDWLIASKSSC
jgi:hypothetical protein